MAPGCITLTAAVTTPHTITVIAAKSNDALRQTVYALCPGKNGVQAVFAREFGLPPPPPDNANSFFKTVYPEYVSFLSGSFPLKSVLKFVFQNRITGAVFLSLHHSPVAARTGGET
jgi:hypothetical protein